MSNTFLQNLECPICFDIFEEPRILTNCGHTLCENCILLISNSNNEFNYIKCPLCFEITNYKNIKELKTNFSLINLIDKVKNDKISNSLPEEIYTSLNSEGKNFKKSHSAPDLYLYSNIDIITPYIAEPVNKENEQKENKQNLNITTSKYTTNPIKESKDLIADNYVNDSENEIKSPVNLFSSLMKFCKSRW